MGTDGWTFRKALVAGAVVGLLSSAALGAYVWWSGGLEGSSVSADDVALVLVLPDEQGVAIPRTITRYRDGAATHVDPLATARIPGTTYDALRDAYPFGGGAGVASALAEAQGTGSQVPAYVVVDLDGWLALAATGGGPLTLDVPEHMEVFDGEWLYTFAEGVQRIEAGEVAALLSGAEYLEAPQRESLRIQVAEELARRLATAAGAGAADVARTNLTPEQLEEWLAAVVQ